MRPVGIVSLIKQDILLKKLMHAAVISGDESIVYYLVSHLDKIYINVTVGEAQDADLSSYEGATALHLAVDHLFGIQQIFVIDRLLSNGADRSIENSSGKQFWECVDLEASSSVELALQKLFSSIYDLSFTLSTLSFLTLSHKF